MADVERLGVIRGELGQSVIDVQFLLVADADGGPTAATVGTAFAVIGAEEAEIHQTTEEGDAGRVFKKQGTIPVV